MSSSADGMMSSSTGTSYSEHSGNKVDVLFGTEMTYVLGTDGRANVGMETAFNIGAKSDVGMATNTSLEFGAQVQWFRGWNVEIAKEGGGTYEKAFAVKAGSVNPTAFFTLNLYLGLAIAAQAIAVGASLALIKTVWVPKPDSKGEITFAGNPGFFAAVGVTNLFLGVITALTTLALPKIIEKRSSITPKAAMSLSNTGFAFIGTNLGPLTLDPLGSNGSAGLALSPTNFNLSFGPKSRTFDPIDSEITHFKEAGTVEIMGNHTGLTIEAPTARLTSQNGQTVAQLNFSNVINKEAALSLKTAAGSGSVRLSSDLSVKVKSKDKATNYFSEFKSEPTKATITSQNGASTGSLTIEGANITLQSAAATSNVVLSAAEATLAFSNNNVKVNAMGVDISHGAIQILSPTVPIPDAKAIAKVAAEHAKNEALIVAQESAEQLKAVKDQLNETIVEKIASVQRAINKKVDKVSITVGAL